MERTRKNGPQSSPGVDPEISEARVDWRGHAVWLYHRFGLSFRDVEDLLAQRGITVTYETVRQWCQRFGPVYARRLRCRRGRMGDTWHLDELFVTVQGRRQYLWRAVDEDGDVLDILVQSRRNRRAAVRFFRKLLKNQGCVPRRLITDKLRSYPAACRTVMPSVAAAPHQWIVLPTRGSVAGGGCWWDRWPSREWRHCLCGCLPASASR